MNAHTDTLERLTAGREPTPFDKLMRRRREALLIDLRATEEFLGIEPKERVICPLCRKERNTTRDKSA